MKTSGLVGLSAITVLAGTSSAFANLTITPTFDASITGDANAAAIENTINSAISYYSSIRDRQPA